MRIYTFSVLENTFDEYADKLPYAVAIVEDEDGKRYSANILNYEPGQKIEVGMEVKAVGGNGAYLECELA